MAINLICDDNDDIRNEIIASTKMDIDECKRRAEHTAAVVRRDYSPERFNSSFKRAVQQIVSTKSSGGEWQGRHLY